MNSHGRTVRGSALAVLTTLALAGCSSGPERDETTGELLEAGELGVFELRVGDCLSEFAEGAEVNSVSAVPCSDEHTDEIFVAIEMPAGDYPGNDAVQDFAQNECVTEFERFAQVPWDESELDYGFIAPTDTSWDDGDREVLCSIGDPDASVTGTLEGANR